MAMTRQHISVIRWTAVVILVPVAAFLCVSMWQRAYKALPVYSTIAAWSQHGVNSPDADAGDAASFPLTDQNGRSVVLAGFKGKILVVNFFFTRCPSSCPRLMAHMAQVREAMADDPDVRLLSITVDPGHDSASVLRDFGRRYQVNADRWLLLTGDKKQIYRLARNDLHVIATDGDGGPEDFIHTDKLILIDPQGRIRGYYAGTEDSGTTELIHDIKKLQHE